MSLFSRLSFEISINTLCIGILVLILGSGITSYLLTKSDIYEAPIGMLPVPVQVGRNKISVSKTGDASMRTEYNRRKTIIGSNSGPIKKFGFSGYTNGALETFFLSSILPTGIVQSFFENNVEFDAGSAMNVPSLILDGGNNGASGNIPNRFVDGGNAYT